MKKQELKEREGSARPKENSAYSNMRHNRGQKDGESDNACKTRGQVFTIDFLAAVLVLTVLLGVYLHAVEFAGKPRPEPTMSAALLSQGLTTGRKEMALDNLKFVKDGMGCSADGNDYCYELEPHVADAPTATSPLSHRTSSLTILLEDGKPLGPAHSEPAKIKTEGKGRYADATNGNKRYLMMSSSQNTDPKTNNKKYALITYNTPAFDVPEFCATQTESGKTITNGCLSYDYGKCTVETASRVFKCGEKQCLLRINVCDGVAQPKEPVMP